MLAGVFLEKYVVKGLTKYSRRGLLGEIFDKLRIQCRMQIFEKISQSALNHVLILQNARSRRELSIPLKNIDLQNGFNIFVAKPWKIKISVPMSYIIFFDEWRSSCRRSRPGGRLWYCPRISFYLQHICVRSTSGRLVSQPRRHRPLSLHITNGTQPFNLI